MAAAALATDSGCSRAFTDPLKQPRPSTIDAGGWFIPGRSARRVTGLLKRQHGTVVMADSLPRPLEQKSEDKA
jgi:hypothetical protein